MRVIVTGSRGWSDRGRISDRLALLPGADDTVVVHGAARGVDRIAGQEAEKLGLRVEAHPADWIAHKKAAGFVRNEQMAVAGADLCLAFWDSKSTGTQDMIQRALRHDIPVEIHHKNSRLVIGPTLSFRHTPRPDYDSHIDHPERYRDGPI